MSAVHGVYPDTLHAHVWLDTAVWLIQAGQVEQLAVATDGRISELDGHQIAGASQEGPTGISSVCRGVDNIVLERCNGEAK